MNFYNTVIIGSGPAGLAFANYAKKANPDNSIIIIEKDKVIGGCHKVNRKKYKNENYFCEHGPRIYLGNYVNFFKLLKSMNLNFNDLFIKKYRLIQILNKIVFTDGLFNFKEFLLLSRDFILVLFNNQHGINLSMFDYMKSNDFSNETIANIDIFCRTFDGGDSNKISLNQFISVSIQSLFYSVYVPKIPNDEGLFNYWKRYLENKKVQFIFDNEVIKIDKNKNKVEKIILKDGREIKGDKFIFAMPPENLIKINGLKEAFELTEDYTEKTDYNEYISISFHWDYELDLEDDISTFNTKTDWGLIASNMSSYMHFKESKSKTVISCAIILTDIKNRNNKTANECNEEELIEEVLEQLRLVYKNITKPTLYFINNYYDEKEKKWKSNETAYLKVPNYNYLDFKSKIYNNLYNLGTHNGKHKNSFTSLESAISNSIKLSNIIFNKKEKIRRCFDVRDFLIVLLSIIILILLFYYFYKN
jgi:hypothetical protein